MNWQEMLRYVGLLIQADDRFYSLSSFTMAGQPCISVYWISKVSEKGYRPVLELCRPLASKQATEKPDYLVIMEFSWQDAIDPTALNLN